MEAATDGLWLMMAVVSGAIGSGMLLYGIRQKEPVSLLFGIALGVVPMLASTGVTALILTVALTALFILAKKYI